MNTAHGRLLIIGRDASSAAGALTNLHRCLAKIEARAESLGSTIALIEAGKLGNAKRLIGQALGELDKVTAEINAERRRRIAERRAQRESR